MNLPLVLFAFPIATIILSIVLEKILKCPLLVAATFFAIFLVIAFAFFDSDFLIFVIVYTIISYVVALLTRCILRSIDCSCRNHYDNFATNFGGPPAVSSCDTEFDNLSGVSEVNSNNRCYHRNVRGRR